MRSSERVACVAWRFGFRFGGNERPSREDRVHVRVAAKPRGTCLSPRFLAALGFVVAASQFSLRAQLA